MTIANVWRSLQGQARRWLPPKGGSAPASVRGAKSAKMAALLAVSLFGAQQAAAQTCQPDKLYDIIVGNFHESVAQRTDGSWAGWGQKMRPANTPELSPTDLASYLTGLDAGTILLSSVASNRSANFESLVLTTKGLYVWGDQTGVFEGLVPPSGNVRLETKGLPAGIDPKDVSMMFLTHKVIALVANGHVYMLVNGTSGPGITMVGGGATGQTNAWQEVLKEDGTPLTGVKAVRGQVANTTQAAMMALTDSGDAYTWGSTTLLGDGSAISATRNVATKMQLPHQGVSPLITGSLPKQIGVTGNGQTAPSVSSVNTYFVLYENGELFSMGANNANQLGDNTLATTVTTLTWGNVKRPNGSKFTDVDMFSVQEHDTSYASAALITTGKDLYNWGNNNYNMLGRPTNKPVDGSIDSGCTGSSTSSICTMGMPTGFQVQGSANPTNARYIEMGGHTMVFLRDKSSKFCYVGHKTQGSMGDGTTTGDGAYPTFTCDATPNLNVCGSTGYDYGDAPRVYEAGGGSNLAMHFYVSQEADLYLGAQGPVANDATPKSVIIGTSNVGTRGDYTAPTFEEDAVGTNGGTGLTVTEGSSSFSTPVTFHNTTGKTVHLYAWVDWNNNGKFEATERVDVTAAPNATSSTLAWAGLSGLTPGQRYMRLRLTTDDLSLSTRVPAADVDGVDMRSLGFASDGEMEDHSVWVVPQGGQPDNVPPWAIDVTSAPVGTDGQLQTLVLPGGSNALLNGADAAPGTVVSYVIKTLPSNGTLRYHDGSQWRDASAGLEIEAAWVLGYYSTSTAPDSFEFQAIDNDGAYSSEHKATAAGPSTGGNGIYTIPKAYITAVGDTGTGVPGTSITTNVGSNDTATGGTVGAITSKTDGANGTVTCSGTGAAASCVYTPTNPAWSGTDSYTYTICMAAPYTAVCKTATVSVTVSPPNVDMTVQVTLPATPTTPGSTVPVSVTCTNSGNVAATQATCGIDTPTGGTLTLQSCTPASPQASLAANGTITCTYSYLTPTGTPSVDLTGRTSATNESAGKDGNNTTTQPLALNGADVFAKIESPATANTGDQLTTLVTFGNQGNQPAEGVSYEVDLPAGLDGVQCTGATCAYDPASGKVTVTGLPTTLAGGQQNQVALKWKTPASAANLTLTAVTSTTTAGDPTANNTATAPLAVTADPSKSAAEVTTSVQVPAQAGTNQTVAGKVTYTNIGSVTATGVTYKVALDSGTPIVSYRGTPCTVAGDGTLSGCSLPATLLAGESLELAVSYSSPATAGQGRQITSTVGATNDTNPANNQATGQTTAQATAPSTTPDVTTRVAPPAKVVAGKPVKVPVTFTNISPTTAATSVTYTLTLPAGTVDVACATPATCTINPSGASGVEVMVTSLPTTLQPGQSASMELTYTAPANGNVQIKSRVDANGELPADLGNNDALAVSAINAPGPDMAIDVTTLPPTMVPGTPYDGTFTCTNVGTADATNATCAVTGLPTGVTQGACTISVPAPGAAWTQPGTVPPGAVVTCTVSGTPAVGTPPTTVFGTTGATGDNDPSNNTSQQPVSVGVGTPDKATTWISLPSTLTPGQPYVGRFTCQNVGTAAAANATCTVTGLPGVTSTSCSIAPPGTAWSQNTTVPVNATVTCQVDGTLPAGTTGPITAITHTGATGDTNPANDTATRTPAVAAPGAPDLAIDLTGLPTTLTPGQPYTGTFTCTNVGTAAAASATCNVTGLPPGVTVTPGACTVTPPGGAWSQGDAIAVNAVVTCPVTGTPPVGTSGPIILTGTTDTVNDSDPTNNTRTRTVTVSGGGTPVGPRSIPTLSEWGLIALSALMGLFMVGMRRRMR